MASSPASRRNVYTNNRDYPGCMGGLMHLFDFNQVLAGRKLLTDKKSGAVGLEASRNSLDVVGSIPEVLPKPHVEQNEEALYGYEVQKASTSRKSNGMPIKALIAQELSIESDNKNRAPSVVARLMGLEALPADSKKHQIGSLLGKIDEKFTQRSMVDSRQRHEEIAPHSVRLYAKKAKASAVSGQITPKSSYFQRSESRDRKPGSESQALRNHPQEQQLQEFKKEFEAWQSQKSWAHSKRSSRLDDTHVRMPSQEGLPRERQLDAKPALPREGLPSPKVNAPEDRLHECREFQDALDFLQSNKEFFMRFLHEPNSLFARHLQERESDNAPPLDMMKGARHRRPQKQATDASDSPRPPTWARESPVSRQFERIGIREESRPLSWPQDSPFPRSPGGPPMVDKSKPSMSHSPLASSEESLGLHGQRSYAVSTMASQSRSDSPDRHIPTRIVVLKPSPGRVRNLKSTSPVFFRSPKDHGAADAFREDNADVLERLREKLRRDSSGEYTKSERKSGVLHINEHYRDSSKDPREIAREIARQVRENITRDLMVDSRYSNSSSVQSNSRKKSGGWRPMQIGDSDSVCSDAEHCELTSRAYWDGYTSSSCASLHLDKNFELEGTRCSTDQKAHIIEQVKRRVSDGSSSHGHELRIKNIVFDKDSHRRDKHNHFSAGLKSSPKLKGSEKFTVDGTLSNQHHGDSHSLSQDSNEVNESLRGDLAFGLEHEVSLEPRKEGASFSGRMLPSEPEEAENVRDLQMHEVSLEPRKEGASFSGRMLPSESEEAENVRDLQMHEDHHAKMTFASIFPNRGADLRRRTGVNADSVDLITSNASLMAVDTSSDLATQMEQTIVRMEELDESQASGELAAVYTERKQQIHVEESVANLELCASVCHDALDKSPAYTSIEDFTNVDNLQSNDSRLEPKAESEDQEVQAFDGIQIIESAQSPEIANKHDFHAPVDGGISASLSLATNELNLVDKPVKEQPEQPSPVSVLDLQFQDESSVASEFKELSSDLEELRMRLCLLNFDNGNQDLDAEDGFESELDAGIHSEKSCSIEEEYLEKIRTNENNSDCSVIDMCAKAADGKDKDSEMDYIRDILAASGFLGDNSSIMTQWYAPGQPLNPRLFQNLEKKFFSQDDIQEMDQASSNISILRSLARRHLLFDSTNEVLLNILGPYLNRRVWLSSKLAPPMPTGKDLEELVWKRVWCSLCSHSGSQETLENLVTKDLGKGSQWLDIGIEIEAAGLEVEKAILDDLIEELLLVL